MHAKFGTLVLVMAAAACAVTTEAPEATTAALDRAGRPYVNQCEPDEDLVLGEDGTPVHGISQCAICRRLEEAYDAQAERLGCTEPFPFDACPLDEGLTDCLVWQVDFEAEQLATFDTCEALRARVGNRNNWDGYECGDSCRWSDGWAADVEADLPQPERQLYGNPPAEQRACDAGTPYRER